MSSFAFDDRFVGAILEGRKTSTIRRLRKRPPNVGGMLYLFTGWRTKNCIKLGYAEVSRVKNMARVRDDMPPGGWEALAWQEGFESEDEMWLFLRAKNKDRDLRLENYFLTEWRGFSACRGAATRWRNNQG